MTVTDANHSQIQEKSSNLAVSEIFATTSEILNECGPRLAGSHAAHLAAEKIKQKLTPHSDGVKIDSFSFHPHAFLGFMKVSAVIYILGLVLAIIGSKTALYIAFGLFLIGAVLTITQFVFYLKTFDVFFNKKEGRNVLASLNPKGRVKQQVIISAHHDSAFLFNYLKKPWQKWYAFRILGATFYHYIGWGIIILFLGFLDRGIVVSSGLRFVILGFMGLGLAFLIPYYNFYDKNRGSPGAGDNLISVAIAMQVMKYFNYLKKKNLDLKHTRIIFASFDAEESALRGSSAFVNKYKDFLHQVPTCNINIDSLYDLKDLQFSTSDINGFCPLSTPLAQFGVNQASQLGYQSELFKMVFGGGGTDAAEFARKGIPSTTILGLPTEYVRDNIVYHTPYDTIDKIDPALVSAVYQIIVNMIVEIDESDNLIQKF